MKINKRIAFSFLTIAGTLTAVVGMTLAVFSDSATLGTNILDTGSADLQIAGNFPTCDDFGSSTGGISSTNLAPGEFGTKSFCLKNNSSGDFSLDVKATAVATGGSTLPTSLVTVTVDCGLGPKIITLDGTTQSDLLRTIGPGGQVNCTIKQEFSGTATNGASNKNIHYTVTFTGTQSS